MANRLPCTLCGRIQEVATSVDSLRYVCPSCAAQVTVVPAGALGAGGTATVRGESAPTVAQPATATAAGADDGAATVPAMVFGHYEIIEEISRGGVGIVYKARQPGLNRLVAVKVLQPGISSSAQQVQRFLQEARAAARLQHPHIVPIHDFGVQDGQHYFTMDFIDGESLAERIARGPVQPRDALDLVRQVAEALHYAHQQGVVHRDIKPGNILLDKAGRVKVTDFGLAKEMTSDDMHLTVTGQVMGTPRYMSPEQASGKTAEADARSDIFSLGTTLYEMLTGSPAFEGENVVQMLQKVLSFEPPPPHKVNRKIHRDIETICLKAIEKQPERRYQSALEMTEDITRFLAGEPIEAKAVGPVRRLGRRLRKHGKALVVYLVVLFLTVNGIVFALKARPSAVSLRLETAGAVAKINGVELTADELVGGKQLRAGRYTVRVEAEPLYEPQESVITTRPGERRSMSVALHRRAGTLQVTTEPADAGVTVTDAAGYRATFQGPTIEQRLPTGHYALLVNKENYLGQDTEVVIGANATVTHRFVLASITLWAARAGGVLLSVPVVADFDGDRSPDVVVGSDDGRISCWSARSGSPLWAQKTGDAVRAPLSKADMDGDGLPDVVGGSTDGKVYCLSGKDGHVLWSTATRAAIFGPALLRDINGDGIPEVFVGSADGTLYALGGKAGEVLWKYPTASRIDSCLAWITDAEQPALLVGNQNGALVCVGARTGDLRWRAQLSSPLLLPPRIEDLAGDGQLAVLLPTPQSATDARTMTAVRLADHQILGTSDVYPFRVDLDGDGQKEVVVTTAQATICYAPDGKTVRWESTYLAITPYLADLDRDGVRDLVFNNGPDQLLALSGKTGRLLGRVTLEAAVGRGFALDDVDRDGTPDLVVGAGRQLYCFSWVGGRERWVTRAETYYDVPPVAAGERILVKSSGGALACFQPDQAAPVWTAATAPQPWPYTGLAASDDLVVDTEAASRRLVVRRIADGKETWSARLPGTADKPIGWPAIVGDTVVVGDGEMGLHCFGLADGRLRWQVALSKVKVAATGGGDWIVVSDGANTLRCLARADGKERWHYGVSDPFPTPPALVDINGDGQLDVVALSDNGFVYALDGQQGAVLWQRQLATTRSRSRHRVVLAEVDGDGFPEGVVALETGEVLCLDLKTGQPRWTVALGEMVLGEPSVADLNGDGVPDLLVATMKGRLYGISGKGDAELWSFELGSQVQYSAPVTLRQGPDPRRAPLVFIGTGPPDNGLYCLAGDAVPVKGEGWSGPWTPLTTVNR